MDTNAILSRLEKIAPGSVLESGRFGRSSTLAVWVETKAVRRIARAICEDAELRLNWLENLSVAEIGDALVISWFVRSTSTATQLMIRCSIEVESADARAEISTVRDLWMMAAPFENEASELFGIRFTRESGQEVEILRALLTDQSGFPMRKSFKWVARVEAGPETKR